MTLAAVKKLAISLPLKQRIKLANALYDTIPPMRGPSSLAELEARAEDVLSGKVKCVSGEEFDRVLARMEKSITADQANGEARPARRSR
jgi:putative addiction module component (TIGR02574 family)